MSDKTPSDVVITGIGIVSPIGTGRKAFWDGLMTGRSGAGKVQAFDASNQPVQIACEVHDFDPGAYMDRREASRADRFTQMAIAAASLAWDDAGLEDHRLDPERIGVIVGTGIGGLQTIVQEHEAFLSGGPRRVSPFMVPRLMPNGAAAAISMKYGLVGLNFAPASACATGAHAVGEAYRAIKNGSVDVMLAGGSEAALTNLAMAAFARMGALSRRNDDPERASRPFDADRDGFVFGEGAGVLVLEKREVAEKRGAPILAELAGYGASADAYHVTQPDPEGKGAATAMLKALADAGETADSVDYINAHGTSTPYNDRVETLAIKGALGDHASKVAVSSTKSQTGHLLGAAGAVEAIACVLAIQESVIPATINYETPDPECDLDYVPNEPRAQKVTLAVSNSFGFGGQNACLALRPA
ncbi:MAG TPA: beta-ketoacyl-ACP synthase II [Actinomycetota bacterium]|jgi:3-oxoacyl-[acyl-carrier-protein] synthase II|nr:beta-ketoacyl-ACP synthase II [Actinomycetota bacterium]